MRNIPGFTSESLEAINALLFAEDTNKYEGQCGQKKLREQNKTQRTPEQEAADQARGQAQRGKDRVPSATRSEAAKKAAKTRSQCKGGPSTPPTTTV